MTVRFHPAAREELSAAAAYLDARAPGLGLELAEDAERAVALATEFPHLGRPIDSRLLRGRLLIALYSIRSDGAFL